MSEACVSDMDFAGLWRSLRFLERRRDMQDIRTMDACRVAQAADGKDVERWISDRLPAEDREAAMEERIERDRSALVRAWAGWGGK